MVEPLSGSVKPHYRGDTVSVPESVYQRISYGLAFLLTPFVIRWG